MHPHNGLPQSFFVLRGGFEPPDDQYVLNRLFQTHAYLTSTLQKWRDSNSCADFHRPINFPGWPLTSTWVHFYLFLRRRWGSNSRSGFLRPNGLANRPLHHLGTPPFAESIGIEPMGQFPDHSLANCYITTLPTLQFYSPQNCGECDVYSPQKF